MVKAPHGPLVEVLERLELYRCAVPRVACGDAWQSPRHTQGSEQYVRLVAVRMDDGARFLREHRFQSSQHGQESQSSARYEGLARNPVIGGATRHFPCTVAFQHDDAAIPTLIAQERRQFQQGSLRPVEAPSANELNCYRAVRIARQLLTPHGLRSHCGGSWFRSSLRYRSTERRVSKFSRPYMVQLGPASP